MLETGGSQYQGPITTAWVGHVLVCSKVNAIYGTSKMQPLRELWIK